MLGQGLPSKPDAIQPLALLARNPVGQNSMRSRLGRVLLWNSAVVRNQRGWLNQLPIPDADAETVAPSKPTPGSAAWDGPVISSQSALA